MKWPSYKSLYVDALQFNIVTNIRACFSVCVSVWGQYVYVCHQEKKANPRNQIFKRS